ncbi:MAG: hypothetical protein JRI75_09830, partial [Deltaproteobacteria bacterium]|nr:hypothetical protein [Deltaproteobacteria bacterium]
MRSAVSQYLDRNIEPDEIEEIRICLEKHGEFYHPSRIVARGGGTAISLVVNVAVSPKGREFILNEFRLLQRLNTDFTYPFIPKVHCQGAVSIKSEDVTLPMFLGEWFENFNEFHLSRDKTDDKIRTVVWDPVHGNLFLSPDQTRELYCRAAMILTC